MNINEYNIIVYCFVGSMVSACFSKLEVGLIFSAIYDFVALSLSGAYLSVM
jgi:hypothetical protein